MTNSPLALPVRFGVLQFPRPTCTRASPTNDKSAACCHLCATPSAISCVKNARATVSLHEAAIEENLRPGGNCPSEKTERCDKLLLSLDVEQRSNLCEVWPRAGQ